MTDAITLTMLDQYGSFAQLANARRETLRDQIRNHRFGPYNVEAFTWLRGRLNRGQRLLARGGEWVILAVGTVIALASLRALTDYRTPQFLLMLLVVVLAIPVHGVLTYMQDNPRLVAQTREVAGFIEAFNGANRVAKRAAKNGTPGGRELGEALARLRPRYEVLLELLNAIAVARERHTDSLTRVEYAVALEGAYLQVRSVLVDVAGAVLAAASIVEVTQPGVPAGRLALDLSQLKLPADARERLAPAVVLLGGSVTLVTD